MKTNYKLSIILIIYGIFVFNTNLSRSELLQENVVLAINCGGDLYKDSKDIEYIEDSYVVGGQSSDFGSQFDIKNTNDPVLYQTERWSESDLEYNLPILENGQYVLILKFSEVYFNNENEKTFDVNIGNKRILSNVDIYAKVGKSTAYDEYIEFEIRNNKAYYNNKYIEEGYNEKTNELKLIFKKGKNDNPKINAILIVKGSKQDTDYELFKNSLDDLEKAKEEKERKQREIKKRNSLHYDFEEYEEDFIDDEVETKTKSIFISTFIYIIIGSILYLYIFKYRK